MCGIAGMVSVSDTDKASGLLKRMFEVMPHRGPDGVGFVIDDDLERKFKFEELNFERKKGKAAMGH